MNIMMTGSLHAQSDSGRCGPGPMHGRLLACLSFRVAPLAAKSTLRTVFYPPALFLALSDRLDNFEVCAGEEPEDADTEASGGGNRRCNATGSGLQFDHTCILCELHFVQDGGI